MKNIYNIILLFSVLICKAQSPILPLMDPSSTQGAYYKDLNNELAKFVGTWKYQNANETLTIVLEKKTMFFNVDDNFYEDILVGEYRYNVNGIDKVNTLSNLNNNHINQYLYNIGGSILIDKYPVIPGSRRIEMYFRDPERDYLNKSIRIKHIDSPGNLPDKIEIKWTGDAIVLPNENSPINLRVPEQDYILTKQ